MINDIILSVLLAVMWAVLIRIGYEVYEDSKDKDPFHMAKTYRYLYYILIIIGVLITIVVISFNMIL